MTTWQARQTSMWLGALVSLWATPLYAESTLFAYSGVLEHDGVAVSTSLTMQFKVYAGPDTSAASQWAESQSVAIYAGRFSVLLGECDGLVSSSERCPLGDVDTGVSLADVVSNADDLYLTVTLDNGSGAPVTLQNRKQFVPVPYAHLATSAVDFDVANELSVGGALQTHAILPQATAWGTQGEGESGACIYNDMASFKKLMITGNRSAGGDREVGIWDNLTVDKNATVKGNLTVNGSLSVGGTLDIGYQAVRCNAGHCYCPSGKRVLNWAANCVNSGHALYSVVPMDDSTGNHGVYARCYNVGDLALHDAYDTTVICARVN